jgi:hypothetical protein
MVAQADPGRLRVRERNPSARPLARALRPQPVVAAAVVGALVGRRSLHRAAAERRDDQRGDARESQEMDSGDHQQELSLA